MRFLLRTLATAFAQAAQAQHEHEHKHGEDHPPEAMSAQYGPYPLSREASGTSWQPDSSPHAGIHARIGEWRR